MRVATKVSALAPFRVRNFRFQWPADLTTSWAFEMETLILGWYVLVATGSVLLLTLFASLQYTGTLVAPLFGVIGDRFGHRNLLCAMRALYALLAATLMSLAFAGVLVPMHVFVIAALMGLVRPSDQVMRYSLIGAIVPSQQLTSAIGIARTTSDSARVVGALAGAGLVAALGMGSAYAVVSALYAASVILTLRIDAASVAGAGAAAQAPASPWRDLRAGIAFVWSREDLLAAMCLAFLVNMTAYPLIMGVMPYVAKEIYHTDQTGLGYLVASFACGALIGSLVMARIGPRVRPARTMLVFCALWYVMVLVFARMPTQASGCIALALTGVVQSIGMVSMSTLILRNAGAQFRGRVMGIRMLAIYGLPIGLVISGQLIPQIGYPATASVYCAIGLGFTALIAIHWHTYVWRVQAAANAR